MRPNKSPIRCLSVFSNWSLISSAPGNFRHPPTPVRCQPGAQDSHGNLSYRHSPPLREKIMKIRFALNRFFFFFFFYGSQKQCYLWVTLYAIQPAECPTKGTRLSLCVKHGSVCRWLNLAGEVMANVMTTDVRGWRLIQFLRLPWQTTSLRHPSAGRANGTPAVKPATHVEMIVICTLA